MTTQFFTEEYLQALAEDGFAPAPRRPVALVPDDFFTEEYVAVVLEDLAAEAARSGSGDGDDPDGGPAPAAPSARPVALALVAAHAGPAWVELGPADEAELDAFEQTLAESADPLPCDGCGRPASPAVLTDEGLVLCLACGDGPSAPPAARSAVRDVRFATTCRRLACARLGRELAAAR